MQHLWKNAPDWVRFVVMEIDGSWWFYENEPTIMAYGWQAQSGRSAQLYPPVDWRDTLKGRPL